MSGSLRLTLIVLGLLTAVLVLSQLVLGLLILNGNANLVKAHQHSGYTAVAVTLLYVGLSLSAIIAFPKRPKP